jgi:hypothetical protein
MGRGRWDTIPPGEQVPENGGNQSSQDNIQCYEFFVNGLADGIGYSMVLENEISNNIEKSSPYNRLKWGKHLCGNNRCYGVGSVVKAVDIIKNQGQYDNYNEKGHEFFFMLT